VSGTPDIRPRAAAPGTPAEKAAYDDTLHCNRCGFCTSFCPTYLATGDEGLSPRGRNQAFRALLEGRLKDPAEAERAFSTCLLCGACTAVCFAEVPTAKLMSAARAKVAESKGRPWPVTFALKVLLPRPGLFAAFLKLAFLAKRLGVSRALLNLGLLRLISPQLAAAEEISEEVPGRFLADALGRLPPPPGADAVQFLACGPNYLLLLVGWATRRLWDSCVAKAGCAANVCCGLPGLSYGDLDAARALARRNIEELEKYPEAAVLVDDSSCAATIKEYPDLFRDDPDWRPRAEALAKRTKDLVEWLAKTTTPSPAPSPLGRGEEKREFPLPEGEGVRRTGEGVTYHDPCKARYAQHLVDAPRAVLKSSGVDCRELPEADQCCGGGGTYSFVHPDISRAVLDRKVKNIESTGAEITLTSSVSCLLQLQAGLRWAKSKVRALHIAEFLSPE
jgi:glycolate oxidase iron-sulfur subunit